jgi:hypothetical protein
MSSGISLSRLESASPPLSVNSKLETYPPQHPEKSMIFLGTRLTPLCKDSIYPLTISYQKAIQEGQSPSQLKG